MGKSKRSEDRLTMAMWLGMAGAAVDTMVAAEFGSRHIHLFIDRLHDAARHMLRGQGRDLIHEMLEVIRGSVPAND